MKLDIHNRRRKKANESKGGTGKEAQQLVFSDDVKDDDDTEKDGTSLSSQSEERETLESDGHVSTISSAPSSQNLHGESVVSFDTPREIQNNGQKQSPKSKLYASYPDNKSKFSSVYPAGRISFKLYDWNPAEFPRRLRLQALWHFLWLNPVATPNFSKSGDSHSAMKRHPVEFLQHRVCVVASELMSQLQDWNNRREFTFPSNFNVDGAGDLFMSQALTENTRAYDILNQAPFLVPFTSRAKLFHSQLTTMREREAVLMLFLQETDSKLEEIIF